MKIHISPSKSLVGLNAAKKASKILEHTLSYKPKARFVAATGTSQIEFLEYLCRAKNIDWSRLEMFQLDEYIGLPETHTASFRRFLSKNFVEKVKLQTFHFIQGQISNPESECEKLKSLILGKDIDVAFIGIGENGHIAFNDPPADFETKDPYIVVDLDEICRNQQVGEGWFTSIDDVPRKAISMSVSQIMESRYIICTCPDLRKAKAVRACLSFDAPVTPFHPASILKKHPEAYIYLDSGSASLL